MSAGGFLRAPRTAVFAAVCVGPAALGHVLMSGRGCPGGCSSPAPLCGDGDRPGPARRGLRPRPDPVPPSVRGVTLTHGNSASSSPDSCTGTARSGGDRATRSGESTDGADTATRFRRADGPGAPNPAPARPVGGFSCCWYWSSPPPTPSAGVSVLSGPARMIPGSPRTVTGTVARTRKTTTWAAWTTGADTEGRRTGVRGGGDGLSVGGMTCVARAELMTIAMCRNFTGRTHDGGSPPCHRQALGMT